MSNQIIQPGQLVGVNPRYAANMVALWNAAVPDVNYAKGSRGSFNAANITDGIAKQGRYKKFAGGTNTNTPNRYYLPTVGEGSAITIIWYGYCTSTGVGWIMSSNDSTNGIYQVLMNGALVFDVAFSSSAGQWQSTNSAFYSGDIAVFAITFDASSTANTPIFYKNGIPFAVTKNTNPVGTVRASSGLLSIGNQTDPNNVGFSRQRPMIGGLLGLAMLNRVLPANELLSLSGNFWQLFAPRVSQIWTLPPIINLAGAAQDRAAATGNLGAGMALAGAGQGVANAAGQLGMGLALSGNALADATAGAAVAQRLGVGGTAQADSTATAAVQQTLSLSGLAVALASADGVLNQHVGLSGSAASVSIAEGILKLDLHLSGTALAAVSGTGGLATAVSLTGAAVADSTATAQSRQQVTLAATAQAGAQAGAVLNVTATVAGSALAAALAAAGLSGLADDNALTGNAEGVSLAAAALRASLPLAGAAVAGVTASGGLAVPVPLSGVGVSVAAGSGDLTVGFSAQALAEAWAQGDLTIAIPLNAAALASSLAQAYLATAGDYLLPAVGRYGMKNLTPLTAMQVLADHYGMASLTPSYTLQVLH
ncbi:hypothetical protein KFZ76_01945 [Methylovulum psychrotolerans]|uniref:hypothetical protein n=1 Tax=Methylovulum psychrotolerans TaxID=1704499 RepID=UPI001BFF38CA|nr:hypothetical protein [Methylovulum psychrotolerans]MBT9096470.1 hypothetical protein [Methylovulum psychrotolerans]